MKNKLKVFIISIFLLGGMSTFAQKIHDSLKTKPHVKSTGMNKDGTPDKRMKGNKGTEVKNVPMVTPVKPTTTKPVTVTPKMPKVTPPVTPKTTTPDKMIGTDAKGRQIFQGPRGGKYYITSKGNKEYIKE